MFKPAAIVAAASLGAAAFILFRARQGGDAVAVPEYGVLPDDVPADSTDSPGFIESVVTSVQNLTANLTTNVGTALGNQNVQAFLVLIRTGEGTLGPNGYRTMFGGGLFDSYADHPRQRITRGSITSTAAGAYQFLAGTWDEMRILYNLPDFSPASQDAACVGLLKRRNALADVMAGRFATAIAKCNKEWASLPGSPYGQPTLNLARAQTVLASAGGISVETLA